MRLMEEDRVEREKARVVMEKARVDMEKARQWSQQFRKSLKLSSDSDAAPHSSGGELLSD